MDDLTLLYYTSNRIQEPTGERIRQHLLETTRGEIPLISVSQKIMNFRINICVNNIGVSKYNIYKQIYIGLNYIKTPYVACCEDDVLYNYEHFTHRPEKGVFAYDCNMWFAEQDEFWRRPVEDDTDALRRRSGMFGCIVEKDTLLQYLNKKFLKYPEPDSNNYDWGEPRSKVEYFSGKLPLVVFIHYDSNNGRRQIQKRKLLERHKRESLPEDHTKNIELYGDITTVWKKYYEI